MAISLVIQAVMTLELLYLLRKVYSNIDKLWEFQCKANQKLMIYLFGEQLGKHYWDKFTRVHNSNILQFMKGMDSDQKSNMIANIFLDETLYITERKTHSSL